MASFTPGPWSITSISRDTGAIGIGKDRILIAEAHNGYSFMDVVQGNHPEEQFANAHLIAAAPSLFNAATLALDYILNRVGNDAAETVTVADLRSALAQARGNSI